MGMVDLFILAFVVVGFLYHKFLTLWIAKLVLKTIYKLYLFNTVVIKLREGKVVIWLMAVFELILKQTNFFESVFAANKQQVHT